MQQAILSLGKNSLIYGVGSVVLRFISLLLLPLFTAYLSPADYGVIAMLGILTMVVHPLFSLGLGAAMGPSYFDTSNPSNKSRVVWTAFSIHLASGSLLLIAAWLFPVHIGALVRLPAENAQLVSLSLTGCVLTLLATAFIQWVQFEKQARRFVAVTILTTSVATLSSLYFVVGLGWGVYGMVVGPLIGNAVSFVAFFLLAWKATKPSYSRKMLKELLSLGLPMVPGFAFLFILMHSNKYLLEWLHGIEAVGIYSIGFTLGSAISIVTSGFATAWFPFYMSYAERQEECKQLFGRIFTYYTLGVGFVTLLFFIAAKPLVSLLTNEAFHEAYIVVGLVASSHYFIGFYSLFLVGIYFSKEIPVQSAIQGAAVIASLPATYYFVKNFGVLGAGLGLAMGHFLMAAFTYIWNIYRRRTYIYVQYEWRRVGFFALVYLFTASVFIANDLRGLLINTALSLVALLAVSSATLLLLRRSELRHLPFLRRIKL